MTQQQLISVIVPAYNEARNLPLLYQKVATVIENLPFRFEIIFVDDGSRDNSVDILKDLGKRDTRVHTIELARNFGKESATSAGIHAAKGDAAIIMDADLQHPPKLLPRLIKQWQKGVEIVVGVRQYSKHESWLKRFTSRAFYAILRRFTSAEITPNATDFRLIDRKVMDAFGAFTERNRLARGLIDWTGFTRCYVNFVGSPRKHGKPGYTYSKLFSLATNTVTAYSLLPLKIASYLGWLILLFSTILGTFVGIEKFILHDPMQLQIRGTALLAIIIMFLVGVILVCLGFVALYIARIHDEVMNRPLYIIKDEHQEEA
ncbi:MAG TPA: glycosyltransferase family 2 protein [Magnetospirillaceae bacterium]|nr:glycosyltransferase family 2 protein [Magnetospirillaceae bacterium]